MENQKWQVIFRDINSEETPVKELFASESDAESWAENKMWEEHYYGIDYWKDDGNSGEKLLTRDMYFNPEDKENYYGYEVKPYNNLTEYIISKLDIKEMKTKLVTTDIDKETGKVSSDVIYLPDFESLFKNLLHAREDIKDISTGKGMSNEIKLMLSKDDKLKEFRNKIENLFLEYRLHVRKNYPDEYKEIQKIAEESMTGGGVESSAGMTAGTGEQYGSAKAFKGNINKYYYKLGKVIKK